MNWFILLEQEDQEFIKQLVLASGSLKQLAKLYGVSYPTLRVRLDRVIQKIQFIDEKSLSLFETKVMQMVIDEKLSLDAAKELLHNYREEH